MFWFYASSQSLERVLHESYEEPLAVSVSSELSVRRATRQKLDTILKGLRK